jgi:hypothetical protein
MAKTHLKLVTPATKKRAVTPKRRPNSEFRSTPKMSAIACHSNYSRSP